jgi:hypothetical protein
MKRIISVSRRTDIPAFYGDWFMGRLKEGFAGVVGPFGGQKYIISLLPEDVICFVFWSKDFTAFLENLKVIEDLGYKFYFNYTITGLPKVFESKVDKSSAIETLKTLSSMYTPKHINWRFDPIIITDTCGRDFYIHAFETLAAELQGLVERCYFSFVAEYNKVKLSFQQLERTKGVKVLQSTTDFKIELANELASIAQRYGIQMFSCCGDYLVNDKIKKAHCIDGSIIEELFYPQGLQYTEKPTRAQCGCTESTDIGTYNTCPHGCAYCYANVNKERAYKVFSKHERDSAFLGYSKSVSDRWLAEMYNKESRKDNKEISLF